MIGATDSKARAEGLRMFGRVALVAVAISSQALPHGAAAENTVLVKGEKWDAFSTTAQSIPGNVVFAADRITFENGKSLELLRLGTMARFTIGFEKRTITLYKVTKPDDPPLLKGNRLCGHQPKPEPVTFLAVWKASGASYEPTRGFAAFKGDTVPTSDDNTCGTYNFTLADR